MNAEPWLGIWYPVIRCQSLVYHQDHHALFFPSMFKQIMGKGPKSPNQIVTAIGNSWLVSRSKSYQDRIYYFNTLTGDAVWNLSEPEIEKAKKMTQKLRNEEGVTLEECPEPKDPPGDHCDDSGSGNLYSERSRQHTNIEKAKKMTQKLRNEAGVSLKECPEPKDPPGDHCDDSGSGNLYTERSRRHINIEKTKKRTQTFQNESGVPLEECPQRKDSPTALVSTTNVSRNSQRLDQQNQPTQYNKNSLEEQPSNLVPFINPAYNPMVQTSDVTSAKPLGFSIPAQQYNTNVWAVPPTHQIFIAPAVSPLVTQAQTSINVSCSSRDNNLTLQNTSSPGLQTSVNVGYNNIAHDVAIQNNSFSVFRQFNEISEKKPNNYKRGNKRFRFNNNTFGHKGIFRNNYNNSERPDLRLLLRNRQLRNHDNMNELRNANNSKRISNFEMASSSTQKSYASNEIKDKLCHSDGDYNWLEENMHFRGNKLNLDVSSLKNLADPDVELDIWYIAADNDILLNHLNFLNTLLNSDDACRLLVPWGVLSGLRAGVSESPRAQRAVAFLQQRIDAGTAVMADDVSDILNCCMNLAGQNKHAILLSNDGKLHEYKNTINSPMFTIPELKEFISTYSTLHESRSLKSPMDPPESSINITIPNKFNATIETPQTITSMKVNKETQSNTDDLLVENPNKPPLVPRKKTNTQTNSECAPTKDTVDAGVQTELSNPEIAPTILKRREIRLNRGKESTLSQSKKLENNIDKKQYKWRRRRPQTIEFRRSTNDPEQINENSKPPQAPMVALLTAESSKNNLEVEKQTCQQVEELTSKPNYDEMDDSETSSSVYLNKTLTMDKLVIEETSTSGIISNSTSNFDSESESVKNSKLKSSFITDVELEPMADTVMFEVTNYMMEEYLKMRCDEWVSRFVQIMEEALTQILQQPPQFTHPSMPPPWTLHEATECIRLKYRNFNSIVDAGQKLSNTLYEISDRKGKINVDLNAHEYMEMYSYGVYLINSLQAAFKNCEDLQAAAESLSKLLHDIQNPIMDSSHNENFSDNIQDPSANVTQMSFIDQIQNEESDEHSDTTDKNKKLNESQDKICVSDTTGESYNLRLRKRKSDQEPRQPEKEIKFIRNIDIESTFFNSLKLQKKNIVHNNTNNLESDPEDYCDSNQKSMEPKFVRSFKKWPEFEERIKQAASIRETLKLHELDYSGSQNDDYYFTDDEYCSENEYYGKHLDNDDYVNEEEYVETQQVDHDESKIERQKLDINDNGVGWVFGSLIVEIKETFAKVNSFCKETLKIMSDSDQVKNDKTMILRKAEEAYLCINNIGKSLNSIYYREKYRLEDNIQSSLKKAGIEEICINDNASAAYRDIVAKCMDQANILLESVNVIISAVKNE